MVTIKEIAKMAGVSRGTVDRVLNNRGAVNSETAEKINEIIKDMNYKPNKAGIALASQKKKYKIGVVLFSKQNPFFDQVMAGINDKAEELSTFGCTIITKRVAYNVETQLSAIHACELEDIQGLLISPYNDKKIRDAIIELEGKGISVITVNTDIDGSRRLAYVGSNYYECGEAAGALMGLISSGPINLGIITGSNNILCHTERIAGFKHILKKNYPNINIVASFENNDSDDKSFDGTLQMLKKHPALNALFFVAGGVYGGCRAVIESGRTNDLKIITFDMVPTTAEMLKRGIISATICQQPYWQGAYSLEMLFNYLTDSKTLFKQLNYAELSIKIKEIL